MHQLYDKRGIPFAHGDVVKVFHFTGPRRRRYFMYHQCLGVREIGPNKTPYFAFSHLNFVTDHLAKDGPYLERPDGRVLPDYEIVQSIKCDHEERARARTTADAQNKPLKFNERSHISDSGNA